MGLGGMVDLFKFEVPSADEANDASALFSIMMAPT